MSLSSLMMGLRNCTTLIMLMRPERRMSFCTAVLVLLMAYSVDSCFLADNVTCRASGGPSCLRSGFTIFRNPQVPSLFKVSASCEVNLVKSSCAYMWLTGTGFNYQVDISPASQTSNQVIEAKNTDSQGRPIGSVVWSCTTTRRGAKCTEEEIEGYSGTCGPCAPYKTVTETVAGVPVSVRSTLGNPLVCVDPPACANGTQVRQWITGNRPQCASCPQHSTCPSPDEVPLADTGYYSNATGVYACPDGASCAGMYNVPVALPGFYHRGVEQHGADGITACPIGFACPGGNDAPPSLLVGFYAGDAGSSQLVAFTCPAGAVCVSADGLSGGPPVPLPGFWQASNGSNVLLPCATTERCPGGGERVCASGYRAKSLACSECSKGYFFLVNDCRLCPDMQFAPLLVLMLGTMALFAIAAVLADKAQGGGALASFLMFAQTLAIFASMRLRWSGAMRALLSPLRFLALDVQAAGVNCIADVPPIAVVLTAVAFAVFIVSSLLGKTAQCGCTDSECARRWLCAASDVRWTIPQRLARASWQVAMVLQAGIALTAFSAFATTVLEGDNTDQVMRRDTIVLRRFPDIEAWDSVEHVIYLALVAVGTGVILVAAPITAVLDALRERGASSSDSVRRDVDFLVAPFVDGDSSALPAWRRVARQIWPLVLHFAKLAFIGTSTIVNSPSGQVYGALGVLAPLVIAHVVVRPYAAAFMNVQDGILFACSCVLLPLALVVDSSGGADGAASTAFVIIVACAFLVAIVGVFIGLRRGATKKGEDYGDHSLRVADDLDMARVSVRSLPVLK